MGSQAPLPRCVNLKLMSGKGFELGRRWALKPAEATRGKPLVTESLTVVDQEVELDRLLGGKTHSALRQGLAHVAQNAKPHAD